MAPLLHMVSLGQISCYMDGRKDCVWKALEILELKILTTDQEAAGRVSWMFLALLWETRVEV